MQKILFVINTMGRAGAEVALLELFRKLDKKEYDISLYVLMGQGEMIHQIPPHVKVRNTVFNSSSVLAEEGRWNLLKTVVKAFFKNGKYIKKCGYIVSNLLPMMKNRKIQKDKLLWRVVSDGTPRFEEEFDLSVAWLEGGSAYYVSDWVKAKKKVAFIHIDYKKAGYTRKMDRGCWNHFDRIFAVSEDARNKFLEVYPEHQDKVMVFPNIINQEYIRSRAKEPGGFSDNYGGIRILTVGRLVYQKGYDVAIKAMKRLKDLGYQVRWYVLGEGEQRKNLEKKIEALGLENDFLLLGTVENPYPYYAQSDLYVHAVRFEGQGIAVLEAQTLGCPVIVSDFCSSREQIENGKYGISCEFTPESIAACIERLLKDEGLRKKLGQMALVKEVPKGQEKIFSELFE